jgi:monoamine oxidase
MYDLLGKGLTTEMGGEFIDSTHEDVLNLAKELNLDLIDLKPEASTLVEEAYFFEGSMRTEAQVLEAFRPFAARIKADAELMGEGVDYKEPGQAGPLDKLSISEYFDKLGVRGWFRRLLDVAYVTEYGLDAHEQSTLNLLFLISTDLEKFEVFGESDERYKIKRGNWTLPVELARRLGDRVRLGHSLTRIASRGPGFTLSFEDEKDVSADIVLIAIPFSVLRHVEMKVDLPDVKRRSIRELGYGKSATLSAGFTEKVWNRLGYRGSLFTDGKVQLAWDNSMGQAGKEGGITFFTGGKFSDGVAGGTAEQTVRKLLLPDLEKAYPGVLAAANGHFGRWHWPTQPYARGGYSCYKPGQWTSIAGAEIETVGNLYFAGEHCSMDFQGFMNGGAETGRRAAEAILAAVRK